MGSLEFDSVFDCLDPQQKGTITPQKLQEFYEVVHFSPILMAHVDASVRAVCGTDGIIDKQNFLNVLQELDRRNFVEERAFWDFRALDNNADGCIPPKDALLLLRDTHGEEFTMATWKAFMASRISESAEVCFDEIKMWLCDPPLQSSSPVDELLKREEENLDHLWLDAAVKEYDSMKHWQESTVSKEKDKRDYRDSVLTQAERRQKKWEHEGIEAVIFDDGKESDGSKKSKERIEQKDLYHLLEEKYHQLRHRLLVDMVLASSDYESTESDDFQVTLREVENEVKDFWRNHKMADMWTDLPGGMLQLQLSLAQMMGGLANDSARNKMDLQSEYQKMISEGKSQGECWSLLEEKYQDLLKGNLRYAEVLSDLLSRYHGEKEALATTIKTWLSQREATPLISQHYFHLLTQTISASSETNISLAAMATGLLERRQTYKSKAYDPDRRRSERLSSMRLIKNKGRQPRRYQTITPPDDSTTKKSPLDLQGEIISQIMENFSMERDVFIHLLQGPESMASKSVAKQLSVDGRIERLNSLRSQRQTLHEQMTTNSQDDLKAKQRKLLQEATSLRFECVFLETMKTEPNVTEDVVMTSLLADLQQKQAVFLDNLIQEFVSMDSKQLKTLLQDITLSFNNEYLDNIVYVVMGTVELTEEEQRFIDALRLKYKVIRETILVHALRKNHGSAWKSMSKVERQRELRRAQKEEKKLRAGGNWDDMTTVLGNAAKDMPCLRSLLGEDKGEYSSRIEPDEISAEQTSSRNPLANLAHRQEAEQSFLLTWLRSPEVKVMNFSQRRIQLIKLMLEKICVEKETLYESMGYRLGLLERVGAALTHRHPADKQRQKQLGILRCQERRQRLMQNQPFIKEPFPIEKPTSGDSLGWQMLYLNQVIQRHLEEGEQLLQLCQDETLGELQEAAQTMSEDEKQQRLHELRLKRRQLDMEIPDEREESLSILEEAAAIKTLCRRVVLENGIVGNSHITMEDVAASLMTELLIEQDKELATIFLSIILKDEGDLLKLFTNESNARKWHMVENVVMVMTRFEGMASDDKIMKELDDKYDSLRDKRLAEILMKQMGDAEWQSLSEKERQRRLAMLKLRERKLREEGKFDELAKLLGNHDLADKNLKNLIGDSRAEAERKLRERLANRQRRKDLGEDIDEEEDEIHEEMDDSGNILEDLDKRYLEERDALLARLRGAESQFLSDKERQAELLRLKRERRLAEREAKFDHAALALGLIERNNQFSDKLKADKEREAALLRARLEIVRGKRGKKLEEDKLEVARDGNSLNLQNAVLVHLERLHGYEETRLVEMMSDNKHGDLATEVRPKTETEREDLLLDFKTNLLQSDGQLKKRHEFLEKGVCVKMVSREITLLKSDEVTTVSHDDICVSLMADLKSKQMSEAENLISILPDMSRDQLISLQEKFVTSEQNDELYNVVAMVFIPESQSKTTQEDIIAAFDGKYDSLKDKLFAEALMQQMGEAKWLALSEKERQKKLMEIKLKERKLREENKIDEIGKLLGENLQNQSVLAKLLGETKEEQNRKLQEKLERRRQRLARGLSEAECDELEKKDAEDEEQRPRNVLLELQHRIDEERDALLRQLSDANGRLSKEKQRQLELMKLKLQQRKLQQENNFDSAALVLGLAKERETLVKENLQSERERQLRLAKERLEARKNRKQTGNDQEMEISSLADTNSLAGLTELVTKEMGSRHRIEREYLMKLIGEQSGEDNSVSDESLETAMADILHSYDSWLKKNSSERDKQKLDSILKSAVGLKLKKKELEMESSVTLVPTESPQVALLADLQELQDGELQTFLNSLEEKEIEDLRQIHSIQSLKRTHGCHVNLAAVLFGPAVLFGQSKLSSQGPLGTSDEAIKQAIDDKYDAFKMNIFTQIAQNKKGDNWWNNATEEERRSVVVSLINDDKQLREDGKDDEADAILEKMLTEAGMQDLLSKLGTNEMDSEARERLREERLESGMSLDEAMQLEEEEKRKSKSILGKLEYDCNAEKDALLASLKFQTDRLIAEKARQLALAKLRRDKRRLQEEGKVDEAALVLDLANSQKNMLEKSLSEERKRQKALAEKRLAARRNQKLGAIQEDDVSEMEQALQQQHEDNLLSDIQNTDSSSLEKILESVEMKQSKEREMLLQLMDAFAKDTSIMEKLNSKSEKDLNKEQQKLKNDRESWLIKRMQFDKSSLDDDKYYHQVAAQRAEQVPVLTNALAIKLQLMLKNDSKQGNLDDLLAKVKVDLLTDLQLKQALETDNVQNALLKEMDVSLLQKVNETQRKASAEGWYMMLAEVLFEPVFGDDEEKYQQKREEALKNSALQGLSEEETAAILRQLKEQHEANLKTTQNSREMHQRNVQKRLDQRKRKKSFKDDAADEALGLLLLSGTQAKQVKEVSELEKQRQSTLMEERLAARRAARKAAAEKAKESGSEDSRPSTNDSKGSGHVRFHVDETNMKKHADELFRQQLDHERKISEDRARQAEQLRRRREAKPKGIKGEAVAVISLGERQKTMLEKSKQDEFDRHRTSVQERVAQVRYEKTMTMRDRSRSPASRTFNQLKDEAGKDGNLLNEKMKETAQEIESRLKEAEQTESSQDPLLTQESREERLRQRRTEKKKRKQNTLTDTPE